MTTALTAAQVRFAQALIWGITFFAGKDIWCMLQEDGETTLWLVTTMFWTEKCCGNLNKIVNIHISENLDGTWQLSADQYLLDSFETAREAALYVTKARINGQLAVEYYSEAMAQHY